MVIDFRDVNAQIEPDVYPIPHQDLILDLLRGARLVSTFDLTKGFYQIPISSESRKFTAFRSHRGLEQLKVAAMGYKNSPAFFQRKMDQIIDEADLRGSVVAYMDDLLVFSHNLEDHCRSVDQILRAIGSRGLTLSAAKAHVGYSKVNALGHCVGHLGLSPASEKVKAMVESRVPTTVKDLSTTIALFGYYRAFIPNFAQIARPLYEAGNRVTGNFRLIFKKKWPDNLPQNSQPVAPYEKVRQMEVEWTPECDKALATLKKLLTEATTLAPINYTDKFTLYTDASYQGFGLALHQFDKGIAKERPIAFHSRLLKAAEKNYAPTELEAACVVWALDAVKHYVDGASEIVLVTDHAALTWIFGLKEKPAHRKNDKLLRWSLYVSQFADRLRVIHRPGVLHSNADGLSRLLPRLPSIVEAARDKEPTGVFIELDVGIDWRAAYLNDDSLRDIYLRLEQGQVFAPRWGRVPAGQAAESPETLPEDTEYHHFYLDAASRRMYIKSGTEHRLCVPEGRLEELVKHSHEQNSHQGIDKTFLRLNKTVAHRKLYKMVRKVIKACASCGTNSTLRHAPYGPLVPIDNEPTPFSTIAIDWVTGLPSSGAEGYDAFMSVTDKTTKILAIIPAKKTDSAPQSAARLFQGWVRYYGLPSVIISDRDSRFTSNFWRQLAKQMGVKQAMTTAYHAQADGQSERSNQEIEIALRHYVDNSGAHWHDHLAMVEIAHNSSVHASTGQTPFEVAFGCKMRTGLESALGLDVAPASADFIEHRKAIRDAAQAALEWARLRMAGYYDRNKIVKEFKVGDQVLLRIKDYHRSASVYAHPQIGPQRTGPFEIIERVGKLAYRLRLPDTVKLHPVINVAKLELATARHYDRPLRMSDGQELYILHSILKARDTINGREYLVRWRDVPDFESTWESERSLIAAGNRPDIEAFNNNTNQPGNRRQTPRVSDRPREEAPNRAGDA